MFDEAQEAQGIFSLPVFCFATMYKDKTKDFVLFFFIIKEHLFNWWHPSYTFHIHFVLGQFAFQNGKLNVV